MRAAYVVVAVAAALWVQPASAAELWYFDFGVPAVGTYYYEDCDLSANCTSSTEPVQAYQEFQHFPGVAPFTTSANVSFGRLGDLFGFGDRDFSYTATLTWVTHPDGSMGIRGTNFSYFGQGCSGPGGGCNLPFPDRSETRLTAATFVAAPRPGFPGPVPEPSTWAMLLLGFGAIGAAMRRVRSNRREFVELPHAPTAVM